MRHAFGDHIARGSDVRTAQFLMGHANLATTETYLARPRLEDLAAAVKGFSYGVANRTNVLGVTEALKTAPKATTGIESA